MNKSQKYDMLAAYIKNDSAAFYRLAYSYVKNREAALDVVQEAVVKALQHIASLRNTEHMRTWFYRILINESLTYLRKNKYLILSDELLQDKPYMEKDLHEHEDLYAAVDSLDPQLRAIIILRFFENMKISEVAQVLHMNENTVKTRLYASLRKLKCMIETQEVTS